MIEEAEERAAAAICIRARCCASWKKPCRPT
jgi:hypothetical protein